MHSYSEDKRLLILQLIANASRPAMAAACRESHPALRDQVQLNNMHMEFTVDEVCNFHPLPTERYPFTVCAHLRIDMKMLVNEHQAGKAVCALDSSISFLTAEGFPPLHSLEIRGRQWAVIKILKRLSAAGKLVKVENVVVVGVEVWNLGGSSEVMTVLALTSLLQNLTLGGLPIHFDLLNRLSHLRYLTDLTISCLILTGSALRLACLTDLRMVLNANSQALLRKHVFDGGSCPLIARVYLAHSSDGDFYNDVPTAPDADWLARTDPEDCPMNHLARQMASISNLVESLYVDAQVLTDATLNHLASLTHLTSLSAHRLGSGDGLNWLGVSGPRQNAVPVLPHITRLDSDTLCQRQVNTMLPNVTSLGFNYILGPPHHNPAFDEPLPTPDVLHDDALMPVPGGLRSLYACEDSLFLAEFPLQHTGLSSIHLMARHEPTKEQPSPVPDFHFFSNLSLLSLDGGISSNIGQLNTWLYAVQSIPRLASLILMNWRILQYSTNLLKQLRYLTHLKLIHCTVTAKELERIVKNLDGTHKVRKKNPDKTENTQIGLLSLVVEQCKPVTQEQCGQIMRRYKQKPDLQLICNNKEPFFSERFDRREVKQAWH